MAYDVTAKKQLDCDKLDAPARKQLDCKPRNIPDIRATVGQIAKHVPTLDALEKKLDDMNQLHPELKSLLKDLNDITNFDDMKAAHKGG